MVVKTQNGLSKAHLLDDIANWLKAMADPTRLKILHALHGGERCVGDLIDDLRCSQPNVSKHLAILRTAGLVDSRRDGVNIYYRIADPTVFTICETVCNSIQRDLDHRREGLERGRTLMREAARP